MKDTMIWVASFHTLVKHAATCTEISLQTYEDKRGRVRSIELICWCHRKKVLLMSVTNPRLRYRR